MPQQKSYFFSQKFNPIFHTVESLLESPLFCLFKEQHLDSSLYLSIHLPNIQILSIIHLSIYVYIYIFIYLSIYLFINLFIYSFIYIIIFYLTLLSKYSYITNLLHSIQYIFLSIPYFSVSIYLTTPIYLSLYL